MAQTPRSPYGVAVDEKDAKDRRQLLAVLLHIDPWLSRINQDSEPEKPEPGSPMHADDNRLDPYQISHAAWSSLSHAVDHLHCLRTLVRDAGIIHMYAPYTLMRAAFENACSAVWLLQPNRRDERITRRLRLATSDINHGEDAKKITGKSGPRTRQERIEQVRQIAAKCGIDEKAATSRFSYKEIIEAVGDPEKIMLLLWNTCSGMAHGDLWAMAAAAEMIERPDKSTVHVGAFKVSANVGLLAQFTTITVGMTDSAWKLYDKRSMSARLV
jgi:hypothetical protein